MPGFSFRSLPNELRLPILESIDSTSITNLFYATKQLRQYYLYNGFLPRKIDKLSITLESRIPSNIASHFVSFRAESLEMSNWKQRFTISNGSRNVLRLDLLRRTPKLHLLLLAMVRSCKTLQIHLSSHNRHDILEYLFAEKRLLGKIRRVANLSVDFLSKPLAEKFFLNCHFIFENAALPNLNMGMNEVFAMAQLRDCKQLHFERMLPGRDVLSTTTATFYVSNFSRIDDFTSTIKSYFRDKNGSVPGKSGTATVVFCINVCKGKESDYWDQMCRALEGVEDLELLDLNSGQAWVYAKYHTTLDAHHHIYSNLVAPFRRLEHRVVETEFPFFEPPFCRIWIPRWTAYFRRKNLLMIMRIYANDFSLSRSQLQFIVHPSKEDIS